MAAPSLTTIAENFHSWGGARIGHIRQNTASGGARSGQEVTEAVLPGGGCLCTASRHGRPGATDHGAGCPGMKALPLPGGVAYRDTYGKRRPGAGLYVSSPRWSGPSPVQHEYAEKSCRAGGGVGLDALLQGVTVWTWPEAESGLP
jgi:hypothetical protein